MGGRELRTAVLPPRQWTPPSKALVLSTGGAPPPPPVTQGPRRRWSVCEGRGMGATLVCRSLRPADVRRARGPIPPPPSDTEALCHTPPQPPKTHWCPWPCVTFTLLVVVSTSRQGRTPWAEVAFWTPPPRQGDARSSTDARLSWQKVQGREANRRRHRLTALGTTSLSTAPAVWSAVLWNGEGLPQCGGGLLPSRHGSGVLCC